MVSLVAPVLDIVVYAISAVACLWNSIASGVIGTLLLFAYAKIRPKKGSLTKEAE